MKKRDVVRAPRAVAIAEPAADARAGDSADRAASREPDAPDALFRMTFEQAAVGIAHVGLDGRWLWVNQRLCEIVGYTREDLLQRTLHDITHPDDRDTGLACFRRLLAGDIQTYAIKKRYLRAGRTPVWVHAIASLVRAPSGAPQYVVAIVDDITIRTAAQQRLDETTTFLTDSLDYEATLTNLARAAVPRLADWCCVVVVERSGALGRLRVAHVDPAKLSLLHELERRYPLDPAAPEGEPRVLRTGRPELYGVVPDSLLRATARDSEHLELLRQLGIRSTMIVPLIARDHTRGALTFVSTDGRSYGPADLAVALDMAGRAALAVDNAWLYREAQDAVQIRDDFLLAASHDLRTPLATIRGYADMLDMRLESGQPLTEDWLRQKVDALRAEAARMTAAVEAITDVAQLHIGHALTLNVEQVEVADLVRGVAQRMAMAYQKGATPVEVAAPPTPMAAPTDRVRLERVLQNIIGNAINYSPVGTPIRVTVRREDGWAVITVRDQGVGIPADELPYIFTRFYRASTSIGIRGTGIGLAASKAIVEQHGGQIGIESAVGAGTTVTVRLRLAIAP